MDAETGKNTSTENQFSKFLALEHDVHKVVKLIKVINCLFHYLFACVVHNSISSLDIFFVKSESFCATL